MISVHLSAALLAEKAVSSGGTTRASPQSRKASPMSFEKPRFSHSEVCVYPLLLLYTTIYILLFKELMFHHTVF